MSDVTPIVSGWDSRKVNQAIASKFCFPPTFAPTRHTGKAKGGNLTLLLSTAMSSKATRLGGNIEGFSHIHYEHKIQQTQSTGTNAASTAT